MVVAKAEPEGINRSSENQDEIIDGSNEGIDTSHSYRRLEYPDNDLNTYHLERGTRSTGRFSGVGQFIAEELAKDVLAHYFENDETEDLGRAAERFDNQVVMQVSNEYFEDIREDLESEAESREIDIHPIDYEEGYRIFIR